MSTGKSAERGTGKKAGAREMAKAIRGFLAAAGVDMRDPELAETPARVAKAWIDDYLDGYRADPKEILSDVHPSTSREMVLVRSIDFHSMCPHHLLPYRGVAHVAYLPARGQGKGRGVVGFGKLVEIVDAFAHRLILQEQIAEEVTGALMKHVKAAGAACLLDAEQGCMTMRGPKRRDARTVTRAFKGVFAKDARQRAAFLEAVGAGRKGAGKR